MKIYVYIYVFKGCDQRDHEILIHVNFILTLLENPTGASIAFAILMIICLFINTRPTLMPWQPDLLETDNLKCKLP